MEQLYVGADKNGTPLSFLLVETDLNAQLPTPLLVYPAQAYQVIGPWIKAWTDLPGAPVVGAQGWSIIVRAMKDGTRFFLRDRRGEIEAIPYGMYSEIVLFDTLEAWREEKRSFARKIAGFAKQVRLLDVDEVKRADVPGSKQGKAREMLIEVCDYVRRAQNDHASDFWLVRYSNQLRGMQAKYRRACKLLGR